MRNTIVVQETCTASELMGDVLLAAKLLGTLHENCKNDMHARFGFNFPLVILQQAKYEALKMGFEGAPEIPGGVAHTSFTVAYTITRGMSHDIGGIKRGAKLVDSRLSYNTRLDNVLQILNVLWEAPLSEPVIHWMQRARNTIKGLQLC